MVAVLPKSAASIPENVGSFKPDSPRLRHRREHARQDSNL
jgi:hypothetical protein